MFTFLLRAAELLVLAVVAGPALAFTLFIPAVAIELNAANINLLIVAAVLVGFRAPWMWAFIALTKVTPGVGMLWFAVRREWRSFVIATGATAAIVVASWLVSPHMWDAYVRASGANRTTASGRSGGGCRWPRSSLSGAPEETTAGP